ncbi:putative reverse transcriptase domain-containing protein [Tanacetum coccineum]
MLDEGDNWGIDPLEFKSRMNLSFDKHMKIDGRTKKVLFHAWMNGSWNKRRMNDRILSNNNTTTGSFFKPYLITREKHDTKKEDEQSQTKRKYSNTSESIDEQPNKRMCKAEKFEAIQYSLGPNEEYIAIRRSPGFYLRNNANPSYKERRQSMEDTLSKFKSESAKRHEENSNLIKENRASRDAAIRNQGSLIKTLEIQIRQMSKVLQERGFGSIPSSTKTNPRDQVKSISTTIEADSYPICRTGSSQYAFPNHLNGYNCEEKKGLYRPQFSEAYSEASQFIPQKEKDLGSFTLPCFINNVCFDNALVDLGVSVSVMPLSTYLNLGLDELAHTKLTVELEDKTRILLPSGYQSALDPWKTIFVYTRLGEITGDDLMPTIEEGEVIEKFRTRDDELNVGIDDYPSYCDYDKKIHTDCEGFDTPRDGFGKYKLVLVVNNLVLLAFISTASFEYYYCQVLENMDDYRDEGMGDVIFGEPFLREVRIKTKRFKGIITLYNGDDEVTYQMMRSHPRFKYHTNEKCNKIPPLLKVSEEDKMNGISHPYQKLKGFYKGVLNLGPDYIRDAKMEEWITRGHISVHEME